MRRQADDGSWGAERGGRSRAPRRVCAVVAAIGAAGGLWVGLALASGGPGSLLAWGENPGGALGTASSSAGVLTPTPVVDGAAPAGTTFTQVSTGYDHSLALSSAGQIYSWGDINTYAALGNGSTGGSTAPVLVSGGAIPAGTTFSQLAAGGYLELALSTGGRIYSWGYNEFGDLGDGNMTSSTVPVAVGPLGDVHLKAIPTATQVSAGINFGLALASSGWIYAWGDGSAGQLGNGATSSSDEPVAVSSSGVPSGTTFTQVAAGLQGGLALTSTGHLYAWGANSYGELGNGGTTGSDVLMPVSGGAIPAGTTFTQISAGGQHDLALSSSGQLYAWGRGDDGQLGDGHFSSSAVPVAVSRGAIPAGATITQIAGGYWDSFALTSTGQLYAWGQQDEGGLGTNDQSSEDVPVAVDLPAGTTVAQVATGSTQFHSLAIVASSGGVVVPPLHIGRVTPSPDGENETLIVSLTGPGKLVALETAHKPKAFTVAKRSLTADQAGIFKLTLVASPPAKAILASGAKLRVAIRLTFTPTAGTPSSRTIHETLARKQRHGAIRVS
ncbi:MAG: cell wall anchor protein [Solirubrobacteraceae bacterium]